MQCNEIPAVRCICQHPVTILLQVMLVSPDQGCHIEIGIRQDVPDIFKRLKEGFFLPIRDAVYV